jgi:hypothetical protein
MVVSSINEEETKKRLENARLVKERKKRKRNNTDIKN